MIDDGRDPEDRRARNQAARMLGVGLQFAGSIVLFLLVGQWLDGRLGTEPWLLIGGVMLGATAGFYSLYRQLMSETRPRDPKQPGEGAGKVKRGVWYTVAVIVIGLLAHAASLMIRPEWREGVWLGAVIAAVTQVVLFWLLFVWLLPRRQMLAHGLGMMSRLVVFAVVALLALRWPVATAASTLFTLVAVFFASTVLEPVFLRTEPLKRS